MKAIKNSGGYTVELSCDEANQVYQSMCLKKAMGNLVPEDPLDSLCICIAVAVEREKAGRKKRRK